MIKWDHWHIEASSICALQCPRCPRAEVPESLLNRQLTLEFFQQRIGSATIQQIKKITFCGNDGDPIYCKDFVAICSWLKQINPDIQLVIITNGSHKTTQWWQELAAVLTSNDTVQFSVDGHDQESNQLYRKNSNFDSIIQAIKTLQQHSDCYLSWAAIAFRFNQEHLEKMQNMAQTLGMDSFQLTKSTKFGSKYLVYGANDPLEPTNTDLVASGHRFERIITKLSTKTMPGQQLKLLFKQRADNLPSGYSGICLIGNKGVFLNSRGEFYPCCWVANRYDHNQSWLGRFNLNLQTFDQIINDPFWVTDFLKFDGLECQTKCTTERLQDIEHTTEW